MIDLTDMETKKIINTERYYKMDKALQLIEGTNIAAFWAHLVDAYNYFKERDMIDVDNTLYQAAKVTQAFTGIKTKSQNAAKKRLAEMGFLKYKVASKPGEATKSTFYILYPEIYEEWIENHDYDKLRDDKYKELQITGDKARLDQWINDNAPALSNQKDTYLGQKQIALGTFANHTQGHLQSSLGDISKFPKEHVIETKEVETKEVETTQTKEKGVVYLGKEYEYLQGKSKSDILELTIDYYASSIKTNISEAENYDEIRYIGRLGMIEELFNKFDVDVCVNFYVGILGYIQGLHRKINSNPKAFDAAYKLENLIRFNPDIVFSVENKKRAERTYISKHKPVVKRVYRKEQSM